MQPIGYTNKCTEKHYKRFWFFNLVMCWWFNDRGGTTHSIWIVLYTSTYDNLMVITEAQWLDIDDILMYTMQKRLNGDYGRE